MSKMIPPALLIGMSGMLLISWINVMNYGAQKDAEYNEVIAEAQALEERQIYVDAVKAYETAYGMRQDYNVSMKIVELYELLEQPDSAAEALEQAIKADPTQKDAYLRLLDYYMFGSEYEKAMELAMEAEKTIGIDDDIEDKLMKIRSEFYLLLPGDTIVRPLHFIENGEEGQYISKYSGKLGIYNDTMKEVIEYKDYEDIGLLNEDLAPVKRQGEYYYIDENGYRKLVADVPVEFFGTFGNGYGPAKINGKWGYVDKKLEQYHFDYDFAGCFENGVAAVQQGKEWMVIDTSFNPVADGLEEVLCDDYGFCSTYGAFIAKKKGKYYVFDTQGNVKSEGYEEARMFASDQPAAMRNGHTWDFVSVDGEVVLQADYKDAGSFSLGYAPFLSENGKWGYMDMRGKVLIEPQFHSATSFWKNGYGLVEEIIDLSDDDDDEDAEETEEEDETEETPDDDGADDTDDGGDADDAAEEQPEDTDDTPDTPDDAGDADDAQDSQENDENGETSEDSEDSENTEESSEDETAAEKLLKRTAKLLTAAVSGETAYSKTAVSRSAGTAKAAALMTGGVQKAKDTKDAANTADTNDGKKKKKKVKYELKYIIVTTYDS